MPKTFPLFLLFVGLLWGQVSPTTCTIDALFGSYPGDACAIGLTTGGSWTTGRSASFFPSGSICVLQPDHTCTLGDHPTGTGNANLRVYNSWDNPTNVGILPGSSVSRDVTINGTTVSTTINVHRRWHFPVYTSWNRQTSADFVSASTCSYSKQFYSNFPDNCPLSNFRPGGTYNLPAAGSTGTDTIFGTPIVTVAPTQQGYSNANYTSAYGQYLSTIDGSGPLTGIWKVSYGPDGLVSGSTYAYNLPSTMTGNFFNANFIPAQALVKYGLGEVSMSAMGRNNDLHLITAGTPPNLVDSGAVFTLPDGQDANTIIDGTGAVSSDGWRVVWGCFSPVSGCTQPQNILTVWKYIYVVNVVTGQYVKIDLNDARITWPQAVPNTRTARLSDLGPYGVRYVKVNSDPLTELWVNTTNGTWGQMTVAYPNPSGQTTGRKQVDCTSSPYLASACVEFSHEAEIQFGGNVGWAIQYAFASDSTEYGIMTFDASKGPLATVPLELGGGSSILMHGVRDHHTGARRPYPMVASAWEADYVHANPSANPVMQITAISGNPAVITLSDPEFGYTTLGVSATQQILISCYQDQWGTQNFTGVQTVSAVATSPYRLTLSGVNYTGSGYVSGNCAATPNSAFSGMQNEYEVQVTRLHPSGRVIQVQRIAKHRGVDYQAGLPGGATEYWTQAHTQLSQNGDKACWATNNGEPNRLRYVCGQVLAQMRANNPNEFMTGWPVTFRSIGGTVTVRAHVPNSNNLTCAVSPNIDLASPTNISLPGPASERVVTQALTIGTQYYYQCRDSQDQLVADDTFVVQ